MDASSNVVYSLVSGCLVATIHGEMTAESLQAMNQPLLLQLSRSEQRTVLIDMSSVDLLDLVDFQALRQMLGAIHLMGARAVLIGLQAGLAALLVNLGADTRGLRVAGTLEQALSVYGRKA
ncbi:hypothetical protein DBR47_04255 [Paucibacter sp. KBW04]|uniref:STAS domain-containing protein n=1 Tax=Paucibacter sp. KBW04 TaxID=2153361 RepID=UPI000F569690|nr:STAS domain-containing protein [Paucibacter sp. KBW04]RQO62453.1 hypothetical protein DBR47_04255 [Paucibacter sp. KBW04]